MRPAKRIFAYKYAGRFDIVFADLVMHQKKNNFAKFTPEQWEEQGEALFNFLLSRLPLGTYNAVVKRLIAYEDEKKKRDLEQSI